MNVRYFDPSAWIKRYFQEEGSESVTALFRDSDSVACCRLGYIEMAATIARKCHYESLDQSVLKRLLDDLGIDFAEFRVIPVEEAQIVMATELAVRHRLRTMDAVHLACALHMRTFEATVLISADLELLTAATEENLPTINPTRG